MTLVITNMLIASLAISAVSMTLAKSTLFEKLRCYVSKLGTYFEELVHCPYCLSHWLAAASSLYLFWGLVDPLRMLIYGFATVSLASIWSLAIAWFLIALNILDGDEE